MIHSLIQELPQDDRPREKLSRLGPGALDHAELLALFLRTGVKGRSAIQVGGDLLMKYGSLGALGRLTVQKLAEERGLGLAKASQLVAAFELGARVAREQMTKTPLDSPEQIYRFLGPQLAHLLQEQVWVLLLDPRLCHCGTEVVSIGTVAEAQAHPREVLRPVISRGAYGFILAHNHPSGDPSPSQGDLRVTRRIVEASELMKVRFLDHLIIGRPAEGHSPYYSFREAGLMA